MPSQDILASIVTAIFSHLTSKVAAFPTVEMSLKILVSLCQHDNGMVHMIKYVVVIVYSTDFMKIYAAYVSIVCSVICM